jgi:hypothetical protein
MQQLTTEQCGLCPYFFSWPQDSIQLYQTNSKKTYLGTKLKLSSEIFANHGMNTHLKICYLMCLNLKRKNSFYYLQYS